MCDWDAMHNIHIGYVVIMHIYIYWRMILTNTLPSILDKSYNIIINKVNVFCTIKHPLFQDVVDLFLTGPAKEWTFLFEMDLRYRYFT